MIVIALACASLLFLALAAHPFFTYPLSLRLLKLRNTTAAAAAAAPVRSMAICVCAYNEERVILAKMENMMLLRRGLAARGVALDVLVYVDCAADRTAALLEPWRDRARIVVASERHGKTYGMNLLAQMAQTQRPAPADIIVFTDANVMVDEQALPALAAAFADPRIGCVCGHLLYRNGDGTPTAGVGSLYWQLEETIKDRESGAGAAMGADGSLFAIRAGLHRPVPPNLIDDFYLSLSILCDGYHIVRANDALAYEDSVTLSHEEFKRKIRIACQAFNVHRILWPRLSKLSPAVLYMYLSHKLLRWVAIFNLSLSALFGVAALVSLGVPGLVILALGLVGAGALVWAVRRQRTPLARLGEILLALTGTGIGVVQSWRGHQFQTWTPAGSIRQS